MKERPVAFIFLLVPLTWLIICFIIGIKENWRIDIVIWEILALVPCIIVLIIIFKHSNYHLIGSTRIIIVFGISVIIYIFIILIELIATSAFFNLFQYAKQVISNSSWWINLLFSALFSFSVAATIEESAKFSIAFFSITDKDKLLFLKYFFIKIY